MHNTSYINTLSWIPLEILCLAWPVVLSASLVSSTTTWFKITALNPGKKKKKKSNSGSTFPSKVTYSISACPCSSCRCVICSINTTICDSTSLHADFASLGMCSFNLVMVIPTTHILALRLYEINHNSHYQLLNKDTKRTHNVQVNQSQLPSASSSGCSTDGSLLDRECFWRLSFSAPVPSSSSFCPSSSEFNSSIVIPFALLVWSLLLFASFEPNLPESNRLPKGRVKNGSSNGSLSPKRLGIKLPWDPKPRTPPNRSSEWKKPSRPSLPLCILYCANASKNRKPSIRNNHHSQNFAFQTQICLVAKRSWELGSSRMYDFGNSNYLFNRYKLIINVYILCWFHF